jgi:hypothetical protein
MKLKYMLPEYDQTTFHCVDDLVRMCYPNLRNNAQGYSKYSLGQISTKVVGLSGTDAHYIASNSNNPAHPLNGICSHNGSGYFKIWLNPVMKPHSLLFELTLIHELCHGYLGPGKMHNAEWRAFYGKAVIMYSRLMNAALTDVEWQVKHTIRRYRTEENPEEPFAAHLVMATRELEQVISDAERNMNHIRRDFIRMREMRETCHASTLATTPTPAYLASLPKKAGTGFPSK